MVTCFFNKRHNLISALCYHFMPVFNLDVTLNFQFNITHTIYIFTSTSYLQTVSLFKDLFY